MMRRIARSRMTGLIAFLIILMFPGEPLLAALQQGGEDYAKKVKEAEIKYAFGEFDASIKLLEDVLRSPNVPQNVKESAYELLAQNYVKKGNLEQAKTAIKKLLELDPTYVAPNDNPPFAAEVERVRQEMGTISPVEPVVKAEESEWYESPWVWIGGGLLIVGGAVALLLPPDIPPPPPPPLPGPPAMPTR